MSVIHQSLRSKHQLASAVPGSAVSVEPYPGRALRMENAEELFSVECIIRRPLLFLSGKFPRQLFAGSFILLLMSAGLLASRPVASYV